MTNSSEDIHNDTTNDDDKPVAIHPEEAQHIGEEDLTEIDPTVAHISYKEHFRDVSQITYPIILSEIFQNTLPVMDIAFVGQLGKEDLAAAALATVWFNLWNSTMMGFMTAIDTLLAQSFGANQYESFGSWTGSSLVVVFFTTIAISGIVIRCGFTKSDRTPSVTHP